MAVVWMLALAMVAEIILVSTPLPEHLYDWLSVAQELPSRPVDAIVCLGGRYERLIWTAVAYRQQRAVHEASRRPGPQIIVCNAPGAADFMKYLLTNCGVPAADVRVDDRSYTTADHPAGVARLPGMDPARTEFLLVTDHEHSRRVAAIFRKAGYAHFTIYGGPFSRPGPADKTPRNLFKWRVGFIPRILYEYAALAQYWWQGKI
jgi:uncharacterized SAM-binding protein YcdF (DUF218 family)